MSYQRSKAPLSLMEQLIMVFVFAFAAAICLQAFVYSDRLSKDGTQQETAAMRATDVIETVKAYHGDLQKAADQLQGETSEGVLTKSYDEDGLRVEVKTGETTKAVDSNVVQAGEAVHQKADISVWEIPADGEEAKPDPVYTVTAAWQLQEQLKK